MLLLERLLLRFVGRLLRQALMILLLFCLECLALLNLLRLEFVLLLLVFFIRLGIACVGSGGAFRWLNILGMDFGAWAIRVGCRTGVVFCRGRGGVNCATFFGGYCAAFFESAWLGRGGDGRLAVIGGGAYLHTTGAAIEADMVDGRVLDSGVVNVPIDADVHIAIRLVVEEVSIVP